MRVLIAAGGTAGHINPALAIAGAIKKADPTAEIHFAGRKEGMEYRLVTQAGYPFHHIEITGFQRKLSLNNIKRNIITLWNLALSGPKAKKMMKDIQPDLVIGCGGYVSGPVVRCAARQGIKTALHEQNAFPGVTNKLLAPDVDIVFAAATTAKSPSMPPAGRCCSRLQNGMVWNWRKKRSTATANIWKSRTSSLPSKRNSLPPSRASWTN